MRRPRLIKHDIRPIAILNLDMRIISALLCEMTMKQVLKLVAPTNYGSRVKGGAEALVELGDRMLDYVINNKDCAIIKLDYWNCFNSMNRVKALDFIYHNLPEWYPVLLQRYGRPNYLIHHNGAVDTMETGFYQGDEPSGWVLGFLSNLIHVDAITKCRQIDPTVQILAKGEYHDDNQALARLDHLALYYQQVVAAAQPYGMKCRDDKSALACNIHRLISSE